MGKAGCEPAMRLCSAHMGDLRLKSNCFLLQRSKEKLKRRVPWPVRAA
jgi:hypothetical protein